MNDDSDDYYRITDAVIVATAIGAGVYVVIAFLVGWLV